MERRTFINVSPPDAGVAWRGASFVSRINKVTPRRARLVLGWVTVLREGTPSRCVTRDGSVAEWIVCWTQAQKSLGSNRSHDAVG